MIVPGGLIYNKAGHVDLSTLLQWPMQRVILTPAAAASGSRLSLLEMDPRSGIATVKDGDDTVGGGTQDGYSSTASGSPNVQTMGGIGFRNDLSVTVSLQKFAANMKYSFTGGLKVWVDASDTLNPVWNDGGAVYTQAAQTFTAGLHDVRSWASGVIPIPAGSSCFIVFGRTGGGQSHDGFSLASNTPDTGLTALPYRFGSLSAMSATANLVEGTVEVLAPAVDPTLPDPTAGKIKIATLGDIAHPIVPSGNIFAQYAPDGSYPANHVPIIPNFDYYKVF